MEVRQLGQIFTPAIIVGRVLKLRSNFGSVLEPSCGNGAFLTQLESTAVGLEIDPKIAHPAALRVDFFDYSTENRFNTIIGNPPYVAAKHIREATRNKLDQSRFDNRANLYLHFIDKCVDHLLPNGELIFITPRDFLKLTASKKLNERLRREGSFTHFFDLGDQRVFERASPNCAIWRWQKDEINSETQTNKGVRYFGCVDGQICFTLGRYVIPFKEKFFVKVGAVSGSDQHFIHPDGEEFVFSGTVKTGLTRRMIYDRHHPSLDPHKGPLLSRRIKKFDETNWFRWGRGYHNSDLPRVYVNCKTRQHKPFFTHVCKRYDGSVLAIFCRDMAAEDARDLLNGVDWDDLGFKVGGRFMFNQRSLENVLLPQSPSSVSMTPQADKAGSSPST